MNKITSIKISTEARDKLNDFTKKYNQKSVSESIIKIFNYIENNRIDLNVNFNNGTYYVVKNIEENISEKFKKSNEQMIKDAKRLEHLISVVKNIEKDYFFPLKEQGLLKVATEREMKEDLKYKDLFEDLINKISGVFSTKRQKTVYLVDISKTEFDILKNYARHF